MKLNKAKDFRAEAELISSRSFNNVKQNRQFNEVISNFSFKCIYT